MYDSTKDTLDHISTVSTYMGQIVADLISRIISHDRSKLSAPEKAVFDEYTPKLKGTTYGSDEYKKNLQEMRVAIDHHNKMNRHHPEYFDDGMQGMNMIDLLELLCDWKAAGERHADGSIEKSLLHNKGRFKMSPYLLRLMTITVRDLGWMSYQTEKLETDWEEFKKLQDRAVVASDYRLSVGAMDCSEEDTLAMAKFIRQVVPGTPFDNVHEALKK